MRREGYDPISERFPAGIGWVGGVPAALLENAHELKLGPVHRAVLVALLIDMRQNDEALEARSRNLQDRTGYSDRSVRGALRRPLNGRSDRA